MTHEVPNNVHKPYSYSSSYIRHPVAGSRRKRGELLGPNVDPMLRRVQLPTWRAVPSDSSPGNHWLFWSFDWSRPSSPNLYTAHISDKLTFPETIIRSTSPRAIPGRCWTKCRKITGFAFFFAVSSDVWRTSSARRETASSTSGFLLPN